MENDAQRPSPRSREPTRWTSRIPVSHVNGLVAVVMFFVSQLLICALHHFAVLINNFPAPILAMLLMAVVMLSLNCIIGKAVDEFYDRYLRGPTDLLNRHMSIGFTVSFMMILKGPSASARDIGLIIGCFVLTGVLNSGLVYIIAHSLQTLACIAFRRFPRDPMVDDLEPNDKIPPIVVIPPCGPSIARRSVSADERFEKCLSEASTLANVQHDAAFDHPALSSHSTSIEIQDTPIQAEASTFRQRALHYLHTNSILCLCLLALLTIGLPIALVTGNDAPFDTCILFTLWTASLTAQRRVRTAACLAPHTRWRTFLSAALNAVLWTALGMIAYSWIKTALEPSLLSIADTLDTFATGTTLAGLIHSSPDTSGSSPHRMGAGDVAVSILNAGIVSWGLKLFECRAQLLSPAGLVTLLTAGAAAACNVVGGPLLARALGVRLPAWCLAFAARSVTLALAGPAMASLGGDVGVNAAMVVFNGIAFQVGMGLGVGAWLRRGLAALSPPRVEGGGGDGAVGVADRDVEKAGGPDGGERAGRRRSNDGGDTPLTVATGVTVGINGAAMGTAHLYEGGSRAAPYSALSMTVFGVITVVITSFGAVDDWLVAQVAG